MNNKTTSLSLYFFAYFLLCSTNSHASLLRYASKARLVSSSHALRSLRLPLATRLVAHSATLDAARKARERQLHSLSVSRKDLKAKTEQATKLYSKPTLYATPKAFNHNDSELFIKAMWSGDAPLIKHLLKRNKQFAQMPVAGFPSTLFYAMHIFQKNLIHAKASLYNEIIELLIHNGANVLLRNEKGVPVLQQAVVSRLPKSTLLLMIKKGAHLGDFNGFYHPFTVRESNAATAETLKPDTTSNALVPATPDAPKLKAPKNGSLPVLEPEDPKTFESFADLAGDIPQEILSVVEYIKSPELRERHKKFGAPLYKGLLLYGPPGGGKTALARSIAKESSVPFFYLKAADIKNKWIGGTEQRVEHVFDCARKRAEVHPTKTSIIFFDELDSFLYSRDNTDRSWQDSEVNAFLTELDGFTPNDQCNLLVLGATNKKEKLDKAAIRPGRFDSHILVDLPSVAKQHAIMNLLLSKRPYEYNNDQGKKDEAIAQVVQLFKTHAVNPSPADLKGIVNESARQAARTQGLEFVTDALLLNATRKHLAQTTKNKSMKDFVL